jgi:dienelactone hydrolase
MRHSSVEKNKMTNLWKSTAMACVCCALVGLATHVQQSSAAESSAEMRQPWQPAAGRSFIRSWLICGQFGAPLENDDDVAPDFLREHGGESAIVPSAGMSHTGPDQKRHAWIAHDSPTDVVDIAAVLKAQPMGYSVSYAFTTIDSDKDVRTLLAMGIDGGVILYVNGEKVYTHLVGRVLTPDEDVVEIALKKGRNRLLFKIQNVWGNVAICARLADPDMLLERAAELSISANADSAFIDVQIDNSLVRQVEVRPSAVVELVAPGGRVLATQTSMRGESIRFDVSSMNPGPYELRCSTTTSDGRSSVSYLPYYKGDMLAAARRLVQDAAQATPDDLITPMLAELVLHRLRGKIEERKLIPENAFAGIHSALMERAERLLAFDDSSAQVRPNGFVRLSWIDPIDDSPQFCRSYLPPRYDSSMKWPLVVNLHGYYGANPRYVGWWSADARHNHIADDHEVILIEPHGRGNTTYQNIGQLDVLRAIREAKAAFSVDPDRVLLVGQSMGGWGTWHVGTRYPELFAAIGPIYGGSDFRARFTPEQLAQLTPYRRFILEAGSSLAQAESLLTTPIYAHHGDADTAVPVDFTRYNVRMLQRWGYDIRYREYPGKGHGGLEAEYETTRWFLPLKRTHPKQVRLRSAELKSAHSHWLAVLQREDPMAFILGDARITAPNTIRLKTQNALEVALTPGDLIDASKPARVVWNDQPAREVRVEDGRILLRSDDYSPGELVKSPQIEGPMSDVINTPFAVIVGTTSADQKMREACRAHANRLIANIESPLPPSR